MRVWKTATVALVAALMVSGCSGNDAPAPEPTPLFTSDEEAFAAAEETYRAYVDALNQVDLSDPETFEAVYAWTTGDANAGERTNLSRMHADEWRVAGESIVQGFEGVSATEALVQALVCIDVSAVTLVDVDGTTQVGTDRPDLNNLSVQLVAGPSATGLQISTSNAVASGPCQ